MTKLDMDPRLRDYLEDNGWKCIFYDRNCYEFTKYDKPKKKYIRDYKEYCEDAKVPMVKLKWKVSPKYDGIFSLTYFPNGERGEGIVNYSSANSYRHLETLQDFIYFLKLKRIEKKLYGAIGVTDINAYYESKNKNG